MNVKTDYSEKLKDPRWQKKRLEILERDQWMCQHCYDTKSTLSVHHLYYESSRDPWDYDDAALVTLCNDCHQFEYDNINISAKNLIISMKKAGFTTSDFKEIAHGFNVMPQFHFHDVLACTIRYAIENLAEIEALYTDSLKGKRPQYQHYFAKEIDNV